MSQDGLARPGRSAYQVYHGNPRERGDNAQQDAKRTISPSAWRPKQLRQSLLNDLRLRPSLLDRHFDPTAEENWNVIFERHTILAFVDYHLLSVGKPLLEIIYVGLT